jgi:hypothetical protein
MYVLEDDGVRCGVIARTIGGPFAVLIAELLRVSGTQLILGADVGWTRVSIAALR